MSCLKKYSSCFFTGYSRFFIAFSVFLMIFLVVFVFQLASGNITGRYGLLTVCGILYVGLLLYSFNLCVLNIYSFVKLYDNKLEFRVLSPYEQVFLKNIVTTIEYDKLKDIEIDQRSVFFHFDSGEEVRLCLLVFKNAQYEELATYFEKLKAEITNL